MSNILEGRPALKKEVEKIAEVAGYLWQNGWAERNGGNITVNVTDLVDDEIKALPAISEVKQIGTALPALKGCYFFCKGTGKRMRDLARWPMENGSIIASSTIAPAMLSSQIILYCQHLSCLVT